MADKRPRGVQPCQPSSCFERARALSKVGPRAPYEALMEWICRQCGLGKGWEGGGRGEGPLAREARLKGDTLCV